MATSLEEEFTLLPLSIPSDIPEILRMHYQVHSSDPLYSTTNTHLPSLSEFIASRTAETTSRFSSPSLITGKLVLTSAPSTIVSYIVFSPPKPDSRSREEKDAELWDSVKEREGVDKERLYGIYRKEARVSEEVLGREWEGKWWALDALVTDKGYQRRGLGSRLVKWGLERVEEVVKKDREGEGERVEGCYLISSQQGSKTYSNAGFEKVGSCEIDMPGKEGAEKYEHLWFVKRFN